MRIHPLLQVTNLTRAAGSSPILQMDRSQHATHHRTDTPRAPGDTTSKALGHTRRASCISSANQSHKLCKMPATLKELVAFITLGFICCWFFMELPVGGFKPFLLAASPNSTAMPHTFRLPGLQLYNKDFHLAVLPYLSSSLFQNLMYFYIFLFFLTQINLSTSIFNLVSAYLLQLLPLITYSGQYT